jgi:uncharacterized protein (DUF342 family)
MAQTFTIQGKLSTIANDTFIQIAIATGLTGTDNTAFRIKEFLIEHAVSPSAILNADSEVQLTRGTKAALVDYSDTSLIVRDKKSVRGTTSGCAFVSPVTDLVPQSDIIVVETQLFLAYKTTSYAALATMQYKILLEEIKISADQRISILSSRLP